jgi:glycosyltransferase involved in cell wall biosynthesis
MSSPKTSAAGLVSVIMPCFNHATFVRDALLSVAYQDYEDLELIVIDDCSKDGSYEAIVAAISEHRLSRRFRNIIIERNFTNKGAHWSLNRGITLSEGEFVTFINSDDLFEKDRFKRMLAAQTGAEADFIAFSAVKLIDDEGNAVLKHGLKRVLEVYPTALGATLPSLSCGFLRYQLAGSTGNILLNRGLMNKLQGFKDLKYCHDWDFMLRAIFFVEPTFVKDTTYFYRIHAGNSFSDLQGLARTESGKVLRSYFETICKNAAKNPLAPSPENWPHVFQALVRSFEISDDWLEVYSSRPYYATRLARLMRALPEAAI